MCGTDYNPNISKIGSKTAYKLIAHHESIEKIMSDTSIDVSVLNYIRVRHLFTEFENENKEMIKIPFCGTPDFSCLEKFLITKKLQINIDKLKKDFTHNIIVFEDSSEEE
jgi:5'-3' exonuclease